MGAALTAAVVALVIPQVLRTLVDGPLQDGDASEIWWPVALVLALGILEAVMVWLRRWFVLQPGTHIEAAMRNSLYRQLQDLPVSFHDRWPSGQLLSRAMSDLNQIRRWMSFGLVLLLVNVATIVIGFFFLVSINWMLGLLFVVCSIPLWVYGYVFEQKYSLVSRRSQDQSGDLATTVEESVHGIRVLKAFGRGKYALKNFASQAESLRGTEIEKARAIASIWLWLLLVPDVTLALCLLGGVWLTADGQLSVGELVAFFATATVLRWPVESIGFLLSMTFDARTAVDRHFEVMDEVNTITDPAEPESIVRPEGRLAFHDVHFRYPDSPAQFADLLDGIDLELEPGETMALVGLTGSGKSTLTALPTRLYDVTGGSITLDGVDVRDLRRDDLRSHIAMAFEDATLFSASVRENVLLGRPSATDAELAEALEIAQAGFVHDLPDGVDTTVGEEGLSLSGGQRQRLALARAVAARPNVLVLDDPLSALDVDTEALVEAALRRVLASTTALIVAHRPSTVMLADRVALLKQGRVTAVGRHSELLATNDHYRFVISSLEDEEERERKEAIS
ncbi:ABC transporter ATP-binding protein [Marisediminicola senii]|uniref:ABC transporter ATP-binding protein n=1 Tax=Marisediminicola senii TaxID=2711233 RepID=UPI0013EB0EFE|nr:ABC transporter ATP-binding protein [Marisediminicola senii]